jgi:hypothetical protein
MPIKWPGKYSKTTNRHNEWSALKKKHAAAIKASKVDFDAGLGGAVDKFENLIKKVAAAGYGASATNADLEKVTQAGLSAAKVAHDYKSKASALADPAKKELIAFLAEIEADAKLWDDATLAMPTKVVKLDTKWVSVSAFAGHLTTIVQRGAEAQKFLAADPSAGTNAELIGLKQHLTELLAAAAASETAAKHLEGLVTNANANPAYLKLLKADSAKALAGPFNQFHQKYQALESYRKANWVADTHMKNDANSGGKTMTNTLLFAMTDLAAVIAAERGLVVQ